MRKLLIVDDDIGIIELFTELFESTELYTIFSASTAEEAFEIIQKEPIEVVLTDYHMPGNDGLWLMSKTRTVLPDCKVVMMTGYASQTLKLDSIKLGAMRFFEKPVNLSNLLRYVNDLFVSGNKYTGNIKDISLIDIIQMLILTQESKLLEISIGEDEVNSEIYLQRGMIIHASYFEESGEEAFKKIITSSNGEFQIRNYSKPPEQTIFTPSNNLLLNILVEKDESEDVPEEIELEEIVNEYFLSDKLAQTIKNDSILLSGIIDNSTKECVGVYHKSILDFSPENESSFTESVLNYIQERRIHRLFKQGNIQFSESAQPNYVSMYFDQYCLTIQTVSVYTIFCVTNNILDKSEMDQFLTQLNL